MRLQKNPSPSHTSPPTAAETGVEEVEGGADECKGLLKGLLIALPRALLKALLMSLEA